MFNLSKFLVRQAHHELVYPELVEGHLTSNSPFGFLRCSFGPPLVFLWSPFAKPMIYGFMVSLPNQQAEPNYLMAEGRA